MANIVYMGYYDVDGTRDVSPAGVTMMRYVISALSKIGDKVTVISPAFSKNGKATLRECRREGPCEVVFPASRAKSRNPFMRLLRQWHHHRAVRKELERQVQPGDTLVVYHSLLLMRDVAWLRRRRNFRFVLQVCEIYSDVVGDRAGRENERRFIQTADAYVFSTELMKQQMNTEHKPFAVCLGTYTATQRVADKIDDGKIHCVYAGTFDSRKGGATAAAAAAFLPTNYHIHILGFGTAEETAAIKAQIAALQNGCTITYDGCLHGEEYIRFIQTCHIGLSTQDPNAAFNATSFPSKILTYMANGLQVVSIRIPAIEQSAVGEYLHFYDEQTPEEIARAIRAVDIRDGYDGIKVLHKLDEGFVQALGEVLT